MAAFVPASAFRNSVHRPAFRLLSSPRSASPPSLARHTVRCTLAISRIANRSYQLEEDEDALSCTTAIYLCEDGTLSLGRTDGPKPESVNATWQYSDADGELVLDIERHFEDGNIAFSVKRLLRGHLDTSRKNLQDLPVFAGAMYQHPADFSPNSEVGWFAMILATDDLPSDDFDISNE